MSSFSKENISLSELFTKKFPCLDASFQIREGQVEIAEKIYSTIKNTSHVAIEAGTGTGKSFAYLVPALLYALQGHKIIIVTATITLQHQLANKDIPYIQNLLQTNIPISILKGKTNYLCKSRLTQFLNSESSLIFSTISHTLKDDIINWAKKTVTGDKEAFAEELLKSGISPTKKHIPQIVWNAINTHDITCGGVACASHRSQGCFFTTARKTASQASIVITNYNVLAYHILKQAENNSDNPEAPSLLPLDSIFILDEAHRIKDIIRSCLNISFSKVSAKSTYDTLFGKTGIIKKNRTLFTNRIKKKIITCEKLFESIFKTISEINEELRTCVSPSQLQENTFQNVNRLSLTNNCLRLKYESILNNKLLDSFFSLSQDTQKIISELFILKDDISPIDKKNTTTTYLKNFIRWWNEKKTLFSSFSNDSSLINKIRYVELSSDKKTFSFSVVPLSIHHFLSHHFFGFSHSSIALSATITTQNSFSYWSQQVGFPSNGETLKIKSPFNYKQQVLLAISQNAPPPNNKEYTSFLIKNIPHLLDISKGRALILCTSKTMVQILSKHLENYSKTHNSIWKVLSQEGIISTTALSRAFKKHNSSVLIATASFWEGFDAPDNLLRLLIITRIPFTSPNDLFFEEEKELCKKENINWFTHLALPIAEIKLKQGFGRLMRNNNDGGVILITDVRIIKKFYGEILLQQLPKCKKLIDNIENMSVPISKHLKNFS